MARRPSAIALVALSLATMLAGCFGDVDVVYVPASAVPDDWDHVQDNKTKELGGGVEVVVSEYRYSATNSAAVYAIGATDVWFVDESDRLLDQVVSFARSADVELTQTATSVRTLADGTEVRVREYDIRKSEPWGEASGQAWILDWDTGGFFAGAIGFATTEYRPTGLLGTGTRGDDTQWRETQEMLLSLRH
ncbi:MAG: hypothetical protein KY455_01205 [Euryarchaeota archaeon]|nr:hypothetical protein [Euryarchaeota archaeon]